MSHSRPPLENGQSPLLARMKSTNHQQDDNGVCFGVAHKGMMATLAGTLDEFDETMEKIYHTDLDRFPQLANDFQNPSATNFIAAFDEIKIFQSPSEYPDLFPHDWVSITQNNASQHLITLLLPQKLEAAGGIAMIHHTSGTGREDKLNEYFDSFSNIAKQCGLTKPIAFVLRNSDHCITISYLPAQQQWVVIDANNLPCKYIDSKELATKKSVNPSNIAEIVISGLRDTDTTSVFSLTAYAQENTKLAFKKCIAKWKKTKAWKTIHKPTKETCNYQDDDNATWLYVAATRGCTEQVKEILDCGPKVNQATTSCGRSPLFNACYEGYTSIVTQLIEHGADIRLTNKYGLTPLHYACTGGYAEIVSLLVAQGADINKKSKRGKSPFHYAIQGAFMDVIQLLIAHGADVNEKNNDGDSPFAVAVRNGKIDIAKLLVKYGADMNVNNDNCTSLYLAAELGWTDVVEQLLANSTDDVNTPNEDGTTPLFIAAQSGFAGIVQILLDHGADCSLALYQPEEMYLEFCKKQAKAIENRMLQFLVNEYWNSSVEKDRRSISGCLMFSLFQNNNSKNYYQMSPVQIAEVMGHQEIVEILQTQNKIKKTVKL
jgi:ankyrin repeat protein